jgi:hypothetical protein
MPSSENAIFLEKPAFFDREARFLRKTASYGPTGPFHIPAKAICNCKSTIGAAVVSVTHFIVFDNCPGLEAAIYAEM